MSEPGVLLGSRVCLIVGLATLAVGATAPSGDAIAVEPHAAGSASQRLDVAVDPRIELFSVLERLAGRPEYGVAARPMPGRRMSGSHRMPTTLPSARFERWRAPTASATTPR